MPILASIMISSNISTTHVQFPQNSSPDFTFTRAIPVNNYVAYNVEKETSFKQLAQIHYGNSEYWTNIWNDNPWIKDPDDLAEVYLIKINIIKPEKSAELNTKLKNKFAELKKAKIGSYSVPIVQSAIALNNQPVDYEPVYKAAGDKFGIPWQILYGLHMTETGGRNGYIMSGYGTGAQGPMQFMPGTWRAYGVDGDGDGISDINNAVDAIHGAANYLALHASLDQALKAYGGNYNGTLEYAKAKGYTF